MCLGVCCLWISCFHLFDFSTASFAISASYPAPAASLCRMPLVVSSSSSRYMSRIDDVNENIMKTTTRLCMCFSHLSCCVVLIRRIFKQTIGVATLDKGHTTVTESVQVGFFSSRSCLSQYVAVCFSDLGCQ
jgi:hypothetical protein